MEIPTWRCLSRFLLKLAMHLLLHGSGQIHLGLVNLLRFSMVDWKPLPNQPLGLRFCMTLPKVKHSMNPNA